MWLASLLVLEEVSRLTATLYSDDLYLAPATGKTIASAKPSRLCGVTKFKKHEQEWPKLKKKKNHISEF